MNKRTRQTMDILREVFPPKLYDKPVVGEHVLLNEPGKEYIKIKYEVVNDRVVYKVYYGKRHSTHRITHLSEIPVVVRDTYMIKERAVRGS